jgi:hypothetical protein
MDFTTKTQTYSLGELRLNKKTKENSPDFVGKIKLHRRLINELLTALEEAEGDTVLCNIAAWQYRDKNGPVLTVQVSEPLQRRQAVGQPNIFDLVANQDEEKND